LGVGALPSAENVQDGNRDREQYDRDDKVDPDAGAEPGTRRVNGGQRAGARDVHGRGRPPGVLIPMPPDTVQVEKVQSGHVGALTGYSGDGSMRAVGATAREASDA
jgi:hypothetical protein